MGRTNACDVCGQPGLTRCRRCAAPLCVTHTPAGGALCDRCEDDYHQRRNKLTKWPWFVIPFTIPWLHVVYNIKQLWLGEIYRYSGKQFTGHPFSDVAIVVLVIALVFGAFVLGLRMLVFKHRFRSRAPAREAAPEER